MTAARARTRRRRWIGILASACLGLGATVVAAKVHDCVDPNTGAVTKSDIPCGAQGETTAEALAIAERKRAAAIKEASYRDARRADEQLLDKHPDLSTYRTQRSAELESAIRLLGPLNARLYELIAERKPLDLEAEFYKGKPLPTWLRDKLEASDASFTALTQMFRDLEHAIAIVVEKYEAPRERLARLWGGTPPGSMGPLVPTAPVAVKR